jgi:O-antigen/teichoic acid export membrane protein
MTDMQLHGHDAPLAEGEREKDRLDRELGETLEEIRVVLPGVQVLFAFLLAVPFQSGWKQVTEFQKDVYFTALCLALVASAMLIAPSAYHRSNFRAYDKSRLIVLASRYSLAGITALAASMSVVTYLIADLIFSLSAAVAVAIAAALLFLTLWAWVPWRDRARMRRGDEVR